jgi:hypothetical protein
MFWTTDRTTATKKANLTISMKRNRALTFYDQINVASTLIQGLQTLYY